MVVERLNVGFCGIVVVVVVGGTAATAAAADGRGDFCDFNWKIPKCL